MSFKLSLARFQKPASRGMDVQFTMPWSSPVSMSASHFGQVAMAGDPPNYEYGSYCNCSRQEVAQSRDPHRRGDRVSEALDTPCDCTELSLRHNPRLGTVHGAHCQRRP